MRCAMSAFTGSIASIITQIVLVQSAMPDGLRAINSGASLEHLGESKDASRLLEMGHVDHLTFEAECHTP